MVSERHWHMYVDIITQILEDSRVNPVKKVNK